MGTVSIAPPQGWKVISQEKTAVSISPRSTEYIPIRVSMARSVTGGVSYLINATLTSDRSLYAGRNQTSVSKACYITVPQTRRWDVYPVQRNVYFDRYSPYSPLKLRMTNHGNGSEVVKLEFEIGSSLEMFGALGNTHFTSIELKPNSDTIVSFPIKYIPYDGSELWNRDFKKFTVRVTATVDTVYKSSSVNFKYLESSYHNILYGKITPLTVEVQLQNLLSDGSPRFVVNAYGMILLKNDDVIDYSVRFMNIAVGTYKNTADVGAKLWRYSRMLATYKSEKWEVSIGDIYSYGSSFFGVVGRGIGGKYFINQDNTIGAAFTAAVGSPLYSGTIFHETVIRKKIGFRSTLNAILDNNNRLNTFGGSVQANYVFLPGQSISILLASSVTKHNYDNQTFLDNNGNYVITTDPGATRIGFATQIDYQLSRKKINAGVNVLFANRDFYQAYSGRLNVNGTAQYFLNNKYSLVGSSGVYLQDPRMYNRGVLYPQNRYLAGLHRVEVAAKLTNKLTFFTGPVLEHVSFDALKINSTTGDSTYTYFRTISPKLSVRASYKNRPSGFVNPYVLFGYTYITSASDSTLSVSPTFTPRPAFFNAKAGLNVIQSNWGVNIFYYLGPRDYVTQSDFYYFGRYSKSLRIMPFFQKYYFNKTMLFSSYNSYYYEVLSNSERISLNARLKFFLGNDWEFFVDNNLYMSSIISSEGNKIYSRSYFLNLGVKKTFDIPQPRVKYYDLKVMCFNDVNGNKIKDDNEQGLSDIVITVDRQSRTDSISKKSLREPGQFSPTEMVTNNFGQVVYYHIPEGEFNLSIIPLINLRDLYNVNGQNQKVNVLRDTTFYVPFVQSFRVVGKIVLNRDEFSSEGAVSAGNVRIVATDSVGNNYPTLSSADGSYTLYVPKAGYYRVVVNNIFGEQFAQQESEYVVAFNGAKEFQVDFVFNEKKRQINMNGGNPASVNPSNPSTVKAPNTFIIAGKDTLKNVKILVDTAAASNSGNAQAIQQDNPIPVGKGITYRIQLTTSAQKVPASQYKVKFKDVPNVKEYLENGVYKYTAGEMNSLAEAKKYKAELRAKGYKDAFMVPFFKGSRVKY